MKYLGYDNTKTKHKNRKKHEETKQKEKRFICLMPKYVDLILVPNFWLFFFIRKIITNNWWQKRKKSLTNKTKKVNQNYNKEIIPAFHIAHFLKKFKQMHFAWRFCQMHVKQPFLVGVFAKCM